MKKTVLILMATFFAHCTMDACVTINKDRNTYDVDGSGCVNTGSKINRPKQEKPSEKKKEVKEKSRG